MFPNPQDALPLPPHLSSERYKKLAKDLVRACRSGAPGAVREWAEDWVKTLVKLSGLVITPELPVRTERWIDEVTAFARRRLQGGDNGCVLAGAYFVIARSHGFESWPKFSKHLQALERKNSLDSRFEAAADAIVHGDMAALERLLRDEPELVRVRSRREHAATLLHYVSANGIEGYRQKAPENIVAIAELLLRAGAEIDATANVYGGSCTTLGLAATSVHPERAGVQEALLEKLLDHGANIDPSGSGNGQSIVAACLANGRAKVAEFLASRGARLDLAGAAGLGRLDLIAAFLNPDGGWKPGVTDGQVHQGFLYACEYGRNNVVELLLEKGVDPAFSGRDGQTGLHWAVIGGQLDTVKLLLSNHAPLEVENRYGGNVLSQALWSAAHGGDPHLYAAILETLVEAGAKVPEHHPHVNELMDAMLERHGSKLE